MATNQFTDDQIRAYAKNMGWVDDSGVVRGQEAAEGIYGAASQHGISADRLNSVFGWNDPNNNAKTWMAANNKPGLVGGNMITGTGGSSGGSGTNTGSNVGPVTGTGGSSGGSGQSMGSNAGATGAGSTGAGSTGAGANAGSTGAGANAGGAAATGSTPAAKTGYSLEDVLALVNATKANNPAPAPAPPPAAAQAPTAQAQAVTRNVDPSKTTAGIINSLLDQNGPLLQRARARAAEQMNARGLLSSNLAIQASDAAAYDVAAQIAAQDAQLYENAASQNQTAQNSMGQFNASQQNQMSQFNVGAQNDLIKMAAAQGYDLEKMDRAQIFELSRMDKAFGQELQRMAKIHGYDLEKMDRAQILEFARMDKNQGFDLEKMSVQQRNALEQMAAGLGMDLTKMSRQQVYTLAQMDKGLANDTVKLRETFNLEMQRDAVDKNWRSAEADKQRMWDDAARRDSQTFQSAEARLAREWNSSENLLQWTRGMDATKRQYAVSEFQRLSSSHDQRVANILNDPNTTPETKQALLRSTVEFSNQQANISAKFFDLPPFNFGTITGP